MGRVKVIQLNLWQGRLLDEARKFLHCENPDIVCLQEVYSFDSPSLSLDFFSSLEILQKSLPGYQSYFSPVSGFALLDSYVYLGNAIFSRFPMSHRKTTFINGAFKTYNTREEFKQHGNQRNLQHVVVHPPQSNPVNIFNHHGFWDLSPLGNAESVAKMTKVARLIDRPAGPKVLCSDLNLKSGSPALEPLLEVLNSLTVEYSLASTLSQFGKVTDVACDHICVSKDVRVLSFKASEEVVSDHVALVLEFNVPALG